MSIRLIELSPLSESNSHVRRDLEVGATTASLDLSEAASACAVTWVADRRILLTDTRADPTLRPSRIWQPSSERRNPHPVTCTVMKLPPLCLGALCCADLLPN